MGGHAGASLLTCVQPCRALRCPFLGVCFRVGRTQNAELGRGPWLVSGSVQGSGACARGQTGLQIPLTPPAPCHSTAWGCATKLCMLPAPIPLGGQCPLHSLLLSLLTQCFELYILQKQPRPIVCTGEGLGALSWGTDFPGSSAEDSRCLWKKKEKKVLLFILRLLTAILCNICCFLFQGGVCVILGDDDLGCSWSLGLGPSSLTLPSLFADPGGWGG